MNIIEGVQLFQLRPHVDPRGTLVALEQFDGLPFAPKRVFFMSIETAGTVRGGHANSCDEFLVVLKGSVLVKLDNGDEHAAVRLTRQDQGLWISAGILIDLEEFESDTIMLVCASEIYEKTTHFARARPELLNYAQA